MHELQIQIFSNINKVLPVFPDWHSFTQRCSLLHVANQVLDVFGDGFGIKQRRVHPSLAALQDDVRLLDSAYTQGRVLLI